MSWMKLLITGFIRANTTENVFVHDLIDLFFKFFILFLEIPCSDLFTEHGVKLLIPQLDEESKAIKDQFGMQEMENNSSDDEYIEHLKSIGEWEETQKWRDKGMCFL